MELEHKLRNALGTKLSVERHVPDGIITLEGKVFQYELSKVPLKPAPTWQVIRISYPSYSYVIEDGFQSLDRLFVLESTYTSLGDLAQTRLLCTSQKELIPIFSLTREYDIFLMRADTTQVSDYRKLIFRKDLPSVQVFYRDSPQHTFPIATKGKNQVEMVEYLLSELTQE